MRVLLCKFCNPTFSVVTQLRHCAPKFGDIFGVRLIASHAGNDLKNRGQFAFKPVGLPKERGAKVFRKIGNVLVEIGQRRTAKLFNVFFNKARIHLPPA